VDVRRRLWGVDHPLENGERLIVAMPVYEAQGEYFAAQRHGWTAQRGVRPLTLEEAEGTYLPLRPPVEVEVGEGCVVLALGAAYRRHLQTALGEAESATTFDAEGFRLCVTTPQDAAQLARGWAERAHGVLCDALGEALRLREARKPALPSLTGRMRAALAVVQRSAHHERFEVALLTLAAHDLLREAARYSRALALYAAELGVEVRDLAAHVEARLAHHSRAYAPAERSLRRAEVDVLPDLSQRN